MYSRMSCQVHLSRGQRAFLAGYETSLRGCVTIGAQAPHVLIKGLPVIDL